MAPTLILRDRLNEGLGPLLNDIADTIARTGHLPSGLLALVDPDRIPPQLPEPRQGALIELEGEKFLPLRVNDTQRRIIQRVDRNPHVVVQGPPGTGKTHLIATLVTHLLAQGQRVLVTAQTDKALAPVRDMMPDAIKPLVVSVLNTTSQTAANADDLRVAVEKLGQQALHNDPEARAARIERHLADLKRMGAERVAAYTQVVDARLHETRNWPESGIDETLVGIRRRQAERAQELDWILPYAGPHPLRPEISGADLARYRELSVESRRLSSQSVHLIEYALTDPAEFSSLMLRRQEALRKVRRFQQHVGGRWAKALMSLPPGQRQEFGVTLTRLQTSVERLQRSGHPWVETALHEILAGSQIPWNERRGRIIDLHRAATEAAEAIGARAEVIVIGDENGLEPTAVSLRDHVIGSPIKVDSQGRPRLGLLAPRAVKAATELFERVTVNGHPPVSETELDQLIGYLGLTRLLRLLDAEWSTETTGTPTQRLRDHNERLRLLTDLTELGLQLSGIDDWFTRQGWELPDWRGFASGEELIATVAALPDLEHEKSTRRALEKLRKRTASEASTPHAADCVRALHTAVEQGDVDNYLRAYRENEELLDQRDGDTERSRLRKLIEQFSPELARDLAEPESATAAEWKRRFTKFGAACDWAVTEHWLAELPQINADPARARIAVLEDRIISSVEALAGERAWAAALDPQRMTPATRTALTAYAQQVRQLGKGTGRHAARLRAEIRATMNQCREAVPAWIMPIHRVIEQIPPVEDSFDIVIVDEASQAGLEALFLHCLAPRILIVGDDQQVSPAGVGQDRQELRELVRCHIPDHPHALLWSNPTRSLFDEATMRYGHRLVLTEHHRSVPEIIGFSNREFYAPEGIRLEPVRQHAESQLEPVRTVFVPNATLANNNVNTAEVEAVVNEVLRCIDDPAYANLTIGVVTLLGSAQARAIEKELLQRVPVTEWVARQLLCGEAPAFQGSERDIIVISMVAAPGGRRLVAQTQDVIAQRYNVAVSRARDQVVLVHSVQTRDLTNPEDLRHRLLSYCTDVTRRIARPQVVPPAVPADVLVPPFESMLEQQVFNLLVRGGYAVRTQQELLGFRIDLVIDGLHRSLAVECEDDTWDGPDAYVEQQQRRSQLEANHWRFVTVRRSDFELDPEATYATITTALNDLDITPVSTTPAPRRASSPSEDDTAKMEDQPEVPFGPEWEAAERTAPVLASARRVAELEDYVTFTGTVHDPTHLDPDSRREVVLAIVDVEGPMTGHRLEQAYADAAGLIRLNVRQRTALGQSVTELVDTEQLTAENPLEVADWRNHAFRLPTQPGARSRTLGPRQLDQVPLPEIALLLDLSHYQVPDGSEDDCFRAVLRQLGLARLNDSVRTLLRQADQHG